jgi:hypothetical protein
MLGNFLKICRSNRKADKAVENKTTRDLMDMQDEPWNVSSQQRESERVGYTCSQEGGFFH